MSLPRYSKYKDSGVEWLGELPEHWGVKKFRYCFHESKEVIDDIVIGPMLSVSGYRGIEIKKYDDENQRRTEEQLVGYRIVREGQLVVNSMWLNAAGLGVSSFEGHVSPAYRSYSFSCDELIPRYAHHLLRSAIYVEAYKNLEQGIRPNSLQVPRNQLMALPILLPCLNEQAAIASFLDRETGKIDALVDEQHRLIELLKEKRQAVISHAVTKGLDPDVAMKDSGVEWLGEVPEHWDAMQLRRCVQEHRQGYYTTSQYTDDGTKLLRITDLQDRGNVDFTSCPRVQDSSDLELFMLRSNDFVFARTGGAGRFGLICDLPEPVVYASYLIRFRFNQLVCARFLRHYFLSSVFHNAIARDIHGGVNQNVHAEDIKNVYISVPPVDEQAHISDALDKIESDFEQLIVEANHLVSLLQERRTALISAAVTGKIDVRNHTPITEGVPA